MTRQQHSFTCPLEEVPAATVDGAVLVAAPRTTAAAAAAAADAPKAHQHSGRGIDVALLVHAPRVVDPNAQMGMRNIYHGLRMRRDAANPWCVWQATRELLAVGMRPQLVFYPEHGAALKRMPAWESQLLGVLAPIWAGHGSQSTAGGASGSSSTRGHASGGRENRSSHQPATQPTFERLYRLGAPAGQPAVGPASRYFELDRVADAALMRMPSDVRVALGLRLRTASREVPLEAADVAARRLLRLLTVAREMAVLAALRRVHACTRETGDPW